jgi:Flp pilus assembly protein TadD
MSRRGVASMVRVSLVGIVVLVATATTVAAAHGQPAFDDAELASGGALELAPPAIPVVLPTREEAVALDAQMHAFVAPLQAVRDPQRRLAALIEAMETRGMFSLEYAEVTRTPKDTFHDRQGNCLSFTMLFVALARAAGLRASYQSVEVPPSWAYDGAVVIANHVNTVVRTSGGEETVVDFNIRQYEGRLQSRRVDDTYALSLFYTNLGAEALLRGDYAAALVYLRGAAAVNADLAGLWVNLGVLYARHGKYEHAEAAYLRALETDGNEPSALANLALVYEALGEVELAAEYRERVQGYRERNPYYHFASATRAFEEQQFAAALASVRKALRLKPDEHEFYTLRGRVQTALGESRDASHSFERAREYEEAEARRTQSLVELGGLALR